MIAALGEALVVIEAGGTGGTLDAGKRAHALGKNVFALESGGDTLPRVGGINGLGEEGIMVVSARGDRLPSALSSSGPRTRRKRMSKETEEERDAKRWLVSAQAGLIGAENELPDLDADEGLALWIALAQAEATVAIAQKLEEIREELEILNSRDARGGRQ